MAGRVAKRERLARAPQPNPTHRQTDRKQQFPNNALTPSKLCFYFNIYPPMESIPRPAYSCWGSAPGVTVDSAINTNPKDLASRDAIDRAARSNDLCQQYGSSAMVMDQRLFVSFNPFNVYVTQADTSPGACFALNVVPVLRTEASWSATRSPPARTT